MGYKTETQTMTTAEWLREGGVVKGTKYMVMEDDLTSGSGHTMQLTDHIS